MTNNKQSDEVMIERICEFLRSLPSLKASILSHEEKIFTLQNELNAYKKKNDLLEAELKNLQNELNFFLQNDFLYLKEGFLKLNRDSTASYDPTSSETINSVYQYYKDLKNMIRPCVKKCFIFPSKEIQDNYLNAYISMVINDLFVHVADSKKVDINALICKMKTYADKFQITIDESQLSGVIVHLETMAKTLIQKALNVPDIHTESKKLNVLNVFFFPSVNSAYSESLHEKAPKCDEGDTLYIASVLFPGFRLKDQIFDKALVLTKVAG